MEKLVIIGTGPAGLTAAVYAARANLDPLVIEGFQPGGQLTTTAEIENYPGFPEGIDGTELMALTRKQAERFGSRFKGGEVTEACLTCRPMTLTLTDGETIEAQSIIIATGASAQYLGIESEQKLIGRGVSGCATCDGSFYRDVPVAVVGGGDTAMEDALFLTHFASKVTVIHRRDQFRASPIMADRVQAHPKVEVLWDTVIEEVLDVEKNEVTGLKVRNVKTNEISQLDVTGVFVAIGHKPNTAPFIGQLNTGPTGYLIANSTRTNIEGVFAAGDVQDSVYRQAITAAGTGCAASIEAERYLESMKQD
ncbi:MAG: thioredoxin-disulfide reductase [Kiritimatiellales bacterium]|nr:thioredoxin-disulfide reductase [Kiritimatiellota bacterium]MBL7011305.1 thioredoxin-disulfide reductase [Kiritimatiellales bacterium]